MDIFLRLIHLVLQFGLYTPFQFENEITIKLQVTFNFTQIVS